MTQKYHKITKVVDLFKPKYLYQVVAKEDKKKARHSKGQEKEPFSFSTQLNTWIWDHQVELFVSLNLIQLVCVDQGSEMIKISNTYLGFPILKLIATEGLARIAEYIFGQNNPFPLPLDSKPPYSILNGPDSIKVIYPLCAVAPDRRFGIELTRGDDDYAPWACRLFVIDD
jgi:hypothetical protein